jgi:hypothetical protein
MFTAAGDNGIVQIVDPGDGALERELGQETGAVAAVCPVRTDGQDLLATAGTDASLRLWDPALGLELDAVPVIGSVRSIAISGRHLVVGTDTGALVLELLGD